MVSLERMDRPEPSENLEPDEAKIWRKIVNMMPPDWFPGETHTLLERYCKHIAELSFIDKVMVDIKKAKKPNMVEWRRMAHLRRQEDKIVAMLATKMRLAQQSSYNKANSFVAKKNNIAAKSLPDIPDTPAAPTRPWS
jgi:hypothetical protein